MKDEYLTWMTRHNVLGGPDAKWSEGYRYPWCFRQSRADGPEGSKYRDL